MERSWEELRSEARERVRYEWAVAVDMLRLPVKTLNRGRDLYEHYCTPGEVVREYVARAGACTEFATQLGLLTPAENGELRSEFAPAMRRFEAAHPEVRGWDQPCAIWLGEPSANC